MNKSFLLFLSFLLMTMANLEAIPFTGNGASGLRSLYNANYIEADFNKDGYMDVFATGNDGTSNYSEIYLNNGNRTFSLLPSDIPQLSQVVADVADFNSDGFVDIVISGINAGQKYCKIFQNNGNNTFTAVAAPIEDVAYGTVLWADFNNDGNLDLFTCGINQAGNYVSHIYKGGNHTFTPINTVITPVSSGSAAVLDYNNDGFADIALTGYNSNGEIVSFLFKNKGNFTFESINAGFEQVTNGSMVAADINADGYTDVVITGTNNLGQKVSEMYLNHNGVFMKSTTAALAPLSSGKIKVADFDNDGYLDLLLTGTDSQGYYNTIMYQNNHDGTFSGNSTLFPALTLAGAALADFDNDNDIDIILSGKTYTGNYTNFYTNDAGSANIGPSAPGSLIAATAHDSVTLSWDKATDKETPVKGLSYNVYLGTTSGNYNFIAPLSTINDGIRRVNKMGNAFQSTSLNLKGLPEGKYYWGVQSIDNNFKGSPFSPESSFTICHNLFVGQDTTVCMGDTVTLHAGTSTDKINWFTETKALIASDAPQLKYPVKTNHRIVVELTNQWGCVLHDTIDLKIRALPVVKLGNDTAICNHSSITLNAGTGWAKVSWFNGSHQLIATDKDKYNYTVTANATFVVAVTDDKGCHNRDTINIVKNELPSFSLGADQSFCLNDTAKLMVNRLFPVIKWFQLNNNGVLASGAAYKYKVLKTDTLMVAVTDANGCLNNDTMVVNRLPLPDIRLPKDTAVCYGEEIAIAANKSFAHIIWNSLNLANPGIDVSAIKFRVMTSDTVKVFVSDNAGCKNSDTLRITKLNLPVVDIGRDTASCSGSQILLNAKPGWKRVDWYKTGNTLLLGNNWFYKHIVTESTKIWAKVVDNNNCVNYDTVSIVNYPLPEFSLGKDTSVCKNNELHLSTKSEYKNTLWKSSVDGVLLNGPANLMVKVRQDDVISAQVTDVHSCSYLDTLKITMLELPALNFARDTTVCYHTTLRLDAGKKWKSIDWTELPGGGVLSLNPVYEHTYIANDTLAIRVTDVNGCINGDTIAVKVAPLPKFSLGRDTVICLGNEVSLFVNNKDYSVNWYSAGNGFLQKGNTLVNYKPSTTDAIIAIAQNGFFCQGSDTILIKVNSLPVAEAGSDTLVCAGSQVTLGGKNTALGNGPFVYSWKSGNAYSNNKANPVILATEDKTYFLNISDGNGCENKDSVKIGVNQVGKIQMNKQFSICKGQKITLGQYPVISGSKFPYAFSWSPDSTLSAGNTQTTVAHPLTTATYRLIASTWKCPADTAYTTVIVRELPKAYVSPTLIMGNEGSVQLYAEGGASYRWSPADNLNNSDIQDPVASPKASTLYTVEIIDSAGCSSQATVQVYVRNEVFVPEIFTPNGDGKNDVFKIYGFGIVELSLSIFDKYNNKVLDSMDKDFITTQGWDGTYKGRPLETGNYRWVIKGHFADGQAVLVNGKDTGVVTLIR